MGRPEAKVENYLRDQVKAAGGQIRKVRWIGRKGAPDNLVWFKFPNVALIECKAAGEEIDPRSLQGREFSRLRQDDWLVFRVRSQADVDAVLNIMKINGD